MTLQNGLVLGSKVRLWADTMIWHSQTGEALGHGEKAFEVESRTAAGVIAANGWKPGKIIWDVSQSAPTNEWELCQAVSGAVREAAHNGAHARVLLAVVEPEPCLWMIANDRPGGAEPFEPQAFSFYVSSGNKTPECREATEKGFTVERMDRVIEAQSRTPFDSLPGATPPVGRYIGGNLIHITVSRKGVSGGAVREFASWSATTTPVK